MELPTLTRQEMKFISNEIKRLRGINGPLSINMANWYANQLQSQIEDRIKSAIVQRDEQLKPYEASIQHIHNCHSTYIVEFLRLCPHANEADCEFCQASRAA